MFTYPIDYNLIELNEIYVNNKHDLYCSSNLWFCGLVSSGVCVWGKNNINDNNNNNNTFYLI